MAHINRSPIVPEEGNDVFEKRGYSPPKDSNVTADDFSNLPTGPAPGAVPVSQQSNSEIHTDSTHKD